MLAWRERHITRLSCPRLIGRRQPNHLQRVFLKRQHPCAVCWSNLVQGASIYLKPLRRRVMRAVWMAGTHEQFRTEQVGRCAPPASKTGQKKGRAASARRNLHRAHGVLLRFQVLACLLVLLCNHFQSLCMVESRAFARVWASLTKAFSLATRTGYALIDAAAHLQDPWWGPYAAKQ